MGRKRNKKNTVKVKPTNAVKENKNDKLAKIKEVAEETKIKPELLQEIDCRSSLKVEFLPIIKKMIKAGLTNKEVATLLQVDESTFYNWKKRYPEIFREVDNWKQFADDEVEKALYQRAVGYSYVETQFASHEGRFTDKVEYIKHCPPDVGACTRWLYNRRPSQWRDKPVDTQKSDDKLDKLIDSMTQAAQKIADEE